MRCSTAPRSFKKSKLTKTVLQIIDLGWNPETNYSRHLEQAEGPGAARRGATAAAAVGPGGAASLGPPPSPPWGGVSGGNNLGRGLTQIRDEAPTYYTKTQHIQQK